jgi:hypothetical protein
MSNPNYREMLGELGKPVLSGEIWQAFADAIQRAGEVVTAPHAPSSPMDRAEGYRYLTRLLNAALTMYVEFADPDYPEFGRLMDTSIKWGLDNVDCLYSKCSIRGDATYSVRGTGGSARYLAFYANQGQFGDPTPEGKTAPGGTFRRGRCGMLTVSGDDWSDSARTFPQG